MVLFFFAVSMFNASLIISNNKSLNSVTLLAKQALADPEQDGNWLRELEMVCLVYDPVTHLYYEGIMIECVITNWEAHCSGTMECHAVYGG